MKYDKIEVVVLDKEGFETDRRDFCTVKEAKAWVKDCAMSRDFWTRRAESGTFAAQNVDTIQLHCDGEIIADWFPQFASAVIA